MRSILHTLVRPVAVVTALVLMGGLMALPAQAAHPDPSHKVAAKASKWKCGKWQRTSSGGKRWCVTFTKITPRVKQDGQDLLHNNFKRRKQMHCELSHSTSLSWHVDGTIEAEAGVIFAKAKTSVTAGVAGETTTTNSTGGSFWVPGKHWVYCARGHAYFQVQGRTRQQVCGEPGCQYFAGTRFNTALPSNPFFEIGPGKHIDWHSFLPQK